jgi:protein-tyrosine phosphatase
MIDLHSHILPGLDDGPRTMDDAVGIARAAVADGIRVLAATPHVRDDWPTTPKTMEGRLAGLRDALAVAGIPLDVRPGGEIAIDRLDLLEPDELARFGLGGNPRALLLEFSYFGWPLTLEPQVRELGGRGITVVVAHPERNAEVQGGPERLRAIVDAGALIQVTAASIDGRIGRRPRETAFDLLERGLVHLIASDAHTPDIRGIGMSEAARAVGNEALARWLTGDVPAAVIAGTPVPPRPPTPRRRRRLLRR